MNRYKHIIWDWNGTLLDDACLVVDVMNGLLNKRSLPLITKEQYMEVFNFPVIDYYKRLGFDFSRERFESISEEFIEAYHGSCYSCSLQNHARQTLHAFSEAGITQSILSAAHQEILEYSTRYYEIENYFIRLVGLDNHHAGGKVENGRKWISELPYAPDEVLLIGDTTHDYEVAKVMGCSCALIANGHHKEERLKACGVPVFRSLAELLTQFPPSV
jgi:phosphoglycolate phosphatase